MGSILTNAFGAATGVAFLGWLVWIFVSSSPTIRLERACTPVAGIEKVATSVAMLMDASEESVAATKASMDRAEYGCRFTLWRVFYEDNWKAEEAAAAAKRAEDAEAARRVNDVKPAEKKR